MGTHAENEGVRMLGEFVCDAIPAPGMPRTEPKGRGVNEGIRVVAEFDFDAAEAGRHGGKPHNDRGQPSSVYIRARAANTDPAPTGREGWPAKYHTKPDCPALRSAETQNTSNDIETRAVSLKWAEDRGWKPCRRCRKR
jgi:hypothetical protein